MAPKSVRWYKPQSIRIFDAGNKLQVICSCFGQRAAIILPCKRCQGAHSQFNIGVKGSTAPLKHVEPLVGMCALYHIPELGISRSKIRRTASDPAKVFFVALFVSFQALCVLPIRSASCFHGRFVLLFVQKKIEQFVHQLLVPPPAVLVVHHLQPVLGHFLKHVCHASVSGGYGNILFSKAVQRFNRAPSEFTRVKPGETTVCST